MLKEIRTTLTSEEGATAVEYGIMVALIAAVIIAIVIILGGQVCQGFETVADSLGDVDGIDTNTESC